MLSAAFVAYQLIIITAALISLAICVTEFDYAMRGHLLIFYLSIHAFSFCHSRQNKSLSRNEISTYVYKEWVCKYA